MAQKKIPMRMCVACRQMRPKRELIRVTKSADGAICIDSTGKISGRGAYICQDPNCLERAQKTRALERALEHRIDDEVMDQLRKAISLDGES